MKVKLFILIFTIFIWAWGCSSIGTRGTKSSLKNAYSVGKIIRHKAYSLSYNETFMQPNWVEYTLKCSDLDNNVSRTNDYRTDPLVTTDSLSLTDYEYSGYDRGHIAPARDMSANEQIMSESFYLSNISPQLPYFNRNGLWKKSEDAVRQWACQNEVLKIIAGPVLHENIQQKGKLFISGKFFKVILANNDKMIGFIFPHSEANNGILEYAMNVDEVEKILGIDLFSELPDDLEEKLESKLDKEWLVSGGEKRYYKATTKVEQRASNTGIIYNYICEKGTLMKASLSGCCSHHGGVYGPKRGKACCTNEMKVICNDGSISPSCTCY